MKYDLVLFDLDGTLVDTLEAITKITNCAMEELGLKQYSLIEGRYLIGNGVPGIVEKVFEMEKYDENKISKQKMLEIIRKYYNIYFNYNVKLYDGIDKLLNFLKENNIKFGIVTNKDQDLANETVKENFLNWNFLEIIGTDDTKHPRKPDPYGVNYFSEKYNIEKNRILFVGDMMVDVKTAQNSKVDLCYCNWGFGASKDETGIDETVKVNTVEDIIRKIKG